MSAVTLPIHLTVAGLVISVYLLLLLHGERRRECHPVERVVFGALAGLLFGSFIAAFVVQMGWLS